MDSMQNPYRASQLPHPTLESIPAPSVDSDRPARTATFCGEAPPTPLIDARAAAKAAGVAALHIKDERPRMGLGSFKALGAAYVIACDHEDGRAAGQTYVTASAGNHGLSVAAGAAAFGAQAVIYLSQTVPESFAARLRDLGAQVVRAGETYEDSMAAAQQAAQDEGAILLSDSSWPGYVDRPHRLMEGYTKLMAEVFEQIPQPPTHIFLQAGVGGLAGAAAAMARKEWGDSPIIVVVEPDAAPALHDSIAACAPVTTQGPVSIMGRLDCKEPSLIALKGLAHDADHFALISEEEAQRGTDWAAGFDMGSTPSGAAGVAALIAAQPGQFGLGPTSRVLAILSEAAAT
ncbi:pyridoxal-phosphate dependent enzyme [Aliishimia ponticola]|uniref:Pyridoxal-phosphate dependent enzyme n=1 Tax=Aliishimia ponticola TaxID=2499833 RepID=A0A4S4NEV3_9RHOB|nr:pyridoxal-phosphate dependent enzyme [Aliishimia ponticola]THH38039.1 pyridoxal-phosphate dependent enzyme [Aliishimia ponticola]